MRGDGTPDDNDRVEIGPTQLAYDEWAAAGLALPHLPTMRQQRLERLAAGIQARGYAGALFFDPLNIRFASDTSNMQLWNTHNPFRACFVGADGYMVLWDFKNDDLLTHFNPLVRETRSGASMFYFVSGDGAGNDAKRFAAEVDALVRERCGDNRRLAVDKIPIHGLRALDAVGFEMMDGEELAERVRSIKQEEEIKAMRCAVSACEQAMYAMQAQAAPGMTENDIWAILHAENIRRGGEWIETRLLASGPRTNPWFQECGPRVLQNNEILGFDTDLVGCYGMCADLSRTLFIGDGKPTDEMRRLYREAHAQIVDNMATLEPGVTFEQLSHLGRPLPEEFFARRYSVKMHGVGLCDEWPSVPYPQDLTPGTFDHPLEPGMMICVEALIGTKGGDVCIKLEDQVLITDDGVDNMTKFPFDDALLA